MQKIKIIVRLPHNRNYAGRLHVENSAGKRLIGPFPVGGRANDPMAYDCRNSGRDPALPFGDTPCGGYQLKKIISSGAGTAYSSEEFGSAGIILLQPVSGDAALADANGCFGFFIQGGALSRVGHLRPTDGSLRLANRDQRKLVSFLQDFEQIDCECWVSDGELVRKGRRIADVPIASVLAQGKKILAGMVGAGILEPAHRAFLKKMLLAGRITMSIPSLLMMSPPPISQHASASHETRTLLAQRHTLSFPVMLAQADDMGGSTTDYGGQLPNTSDATADHSGDQQPPATAAPPSASDFVVNLSAPTVSGTQPTSAPEPAPDQADAARIAALDVAIRNAQEEWGSSTTNQCNLGVQAIQGAVHEQVVTGLANDMVKTYQQGTQGNNPAYATVSSTDAQAIASAGYLVVAARASQPGETNGHVAVVSPNTTGWIGTPYQNPKMPIIGNIGNNKNSSDKPVNWVFGKVKGSTAPAVPPTYYVSTAALSKYKAQQAQASQNPTK